MTTQVALKLKPEKHAKPVRTFTLLEYLKKEEQSIEKHEYYNGKIIPLPGSKPTHNKIAANLIGALKYKLRGLPNKYEVYTGDQKIYIDESKSVLYPDALVICEEPEYWQGVEDMIINPLVIIEVLSKSTSNYDRNGKFMIYQNLESFREYVLVEQTRPEVELWYKIEKNTWQKTVCTDIDAAIELRSLNISILLSEIYEYVKFPE